MLRIVEVEGRLPVRAVGCVVCGVVGLGLWYGGVGWYFIVGRSL
jgi:hypothetical protein